jgi:16S rRNA (guanine966-N2)-methyltransferase
MVFTSNSVRIIGGKWRGRKIAFPSIEGLRPTHDRIRETVFNWLMQDIVDANCLDLFAGSGALGFEALSRGATSVTFVDSNLKVCQSLKNNVGLFKTSAAIILQKEYQSIDRSSLQPPYDIVFLDPPFGKDILGGAITWLEQNALLSKQTKIYIEVEKNGLTVDFPDNWSCSRYKSTSTLDYYLFDRVSV